MEKESVRIYFDSKASDWDSELIRNDDIIEKILDNAKITAGCHVLDVACGTGVLIPDYLRRNVASVTGIDISSEMIRHAQAKFTQENVSFICGDIDELKLPPSFDNIVIYNAFPHFTDPCKLISNISHMLKPNGIFSIAHGMSREKINSHHANSSAHMISNDLISAAELADLMSQWFSIKETIDNEDMYQVTGILK